MRFREHRGSLADSLETAVEFDDLEALRRHINAAAVQWPTFPKLDQLRIEYYVFDPRTGRHTWLVTLPGYGVLGMID